MNPICFFADRREFIPCDDEMVASIFLQNTTERRYLSLARRLQGPPSSVEIERDDQQWVSRNGVADCLVSPNALAITVSQESHFDLGVGRWEITYAIKEGEFEVLVSAITNIFEGTSTVLKIGDA